RVPWQVIRAVGVVLLPVAGVIVLYARAIHESAYGFRYEYPYLLVLFGCAGLLLAELWKQSRRTFAWAIVVGIAWMPPLLRLSQPETVSALLGPWHSAVQWVTTDYEGDALGKLGRDLGETGLEQRAVILLGGAGQVPYYSRFKAIDWIGLNDTRLSGRFPLTIDEVWQYIESKNPDVIYSVFPPATPGMHDYRQDPVFQSPSVQSSLSGNGSELIANWNRDRLAEMFYREMQYIRDRCEFGAAYALEGNWALFAYVRKDSPHRDVIQGVLRRSQRADWKSDLTALYLTDPRTHR
ncbi:MAG: hypothetical protein ACRD1H_16075, partial [Vicinamibacterales bacterium]